MKKVIFWLLIIISFKLQAQPGGGGLIIKKIYDKNLKEITLGKNSIQIELLVLDSVMTILNKNKLVLDSVMTINKNKIDIKKRIFIPPLNNYRHTNKVSGLLITYQNNEYRIDFENIWTENGAGDTEQIDSLVLFKPYILSKRDYYHSSHTGNEFQKYFLLRDLSNVYLKNGITPYTFNKLFELDLMFNTKDYSYNRKPKIWMEDFKNLFEHYRQGNGTHEQKEIEIFLEKLEKIIKKYGINEAFVLFKMRLLYKTNSYKEIINLYEKYPFERHPLIYYVNDILIDCYTKCKEYDKAITICEKVAEKLIKIRKEKYYVYIYHKLFIEIYYQDKNKMKEIQTILDNEEYKQYYHFVFDQLKILQSYSMYKFENKETGMDQMNTYDKKCIPYPILKEIYPSLIVTETHDDFCGSLVFGIMRDIL